MVSDIEGQQLSSSINVTLLSAPGYYQPLFDQLHFLGCFTNEIRSSSQIFFWASKISFKQRSSIPRSRQLKMKLADSLYHLPFAND